MVLGILLACSLVVIIILFLTRNKKQVCQHCKGTLSASYHVAHDSVVQEQQDGETDPLNYAALEFSGRKTKGGKKHSERTQESLYSASFMFVFLYFLVLIQTQEVPQLVFLKSAELGDTVTLHCEVFNGYQLVLYWYKQSLGRIPQMVAGKVFASKTIYPPFESRVEVGDGADFNLTISRINKDDEANYFCNQGSQYSSIWQNGTFLTVNDHNDQRFVSQTVVQQPVLVSVQLGDPVALQCSITSQRTDHRNQCQGEPSVYWFRSGSGPSHPAAIYMNGNRSGECQDSSGPPSPPQSCVYTLHKNNVSTSDAGTYYCALAACGEIVFGQGSKLETGPNWHLVIIVLGVLLAFCLVVIIILFLNMNKKQDGERDPLNYAALEFSGRKTKGGKKHSERTQESLYSATQEVPQLVVLKRAELGDTVTLHCEVLNEYQTFLYWYKQSLGRIPQKVAGKVFASKTIYPPFESRVEVGEGTDFNLTISRINKEDEANYFCNQGSQYSSIWQNGTFLTVNDHNDQRFVSQTVVQQPVLVSVQLGDPVALQCSITSQWTDHRNQCQGEPSVYWFRSGSGSSHPAAIYMNGNRSGECQNSSGPPSPPQSCVYTLHKNNVGTSDAGTYYCALAACGEIVFGQGTKLETGHYILLLNFSFLDVRPNWHLVSIVLGVLLAFCLVVIIILFLNMKKKQDGETDPLNYAALEFSGRKTKGGKKHSERTQERLYSAVRET
ncbi:Immunoglobulin kappa variable 1-12 [Merluccius polli]|nr:Immunoglobulin kappa variable 1-12 [Merluccius polli]